MRCSFPWRLLLMFWSPTPTLSLWHPARESFQKVAGECAMASSMRVCKLLPQDPSVYLGVSENGVYPPSGSLTRKWRFTGDKPTPCTANFFVEAHNVETCWDYDYISYMDQKACRTLAELVDLKKPSLRIGCNTFYIMPGCLFSLLYPKCHRRAVQMIHPHISMVFRQRILENWLKVIQTWVIYVILGLSQ